MTIKIILYIVSGLSIGYNYYLSTGRRNYWLIPFWPIVFAVAAIALVFANKKQREPEQ